MQLPAYWGSVVCAEKLDRGEVMAKSIAVVGTALCVHVGVREDSHCCATAAPGQPPTTSLTSRAHLQSSLVAAARSGASSAQLTLHSHSVVTRRFEMAQPQAQLKDREGGAYRAPRYVQYCTSIDLLRSAKITLAGAVCFRYAG